METYFATALRSTPRQLKQEMDFATGNPVISGILEAVGGLVAVLNEKRQILAVNDSLLQMLGMTDQQDALGLRPGQAVGCIHANEPPHGCGTTKYCQTCGAAIAMVTALESESPQEKTCAISAIRGDKPVELFLRVRCSPCRVMGHRFLLLFLQDISKQQQRIHMERVFFHDLNNLLSGLVGAGQLMLAKGDEQGELARRILDISLQMRQEIAVQRLLVTNEGAAYQPIYAETTTVRVLEELHSMMGDHPEARGKVHDFRNEEGEIAFMTDMSLLIRILGNMLLNALEASEPGETVRLSVAREGEDLLFSVWNRKPIPEEIALRIFQRNFSTKADEGRGLGTYAMKLFGEQFLGGRVCFDSSPESGTTFKFSMPLIAPPVSVC